LGFVAGTLGITIADIMMGTTTPGAGLGPLSVEWFNSDGQDESRDVARHAREVVLTRSALQTLTDLNLLDVVGDTYVWIIPHSLGDALRQELAHAEKNCEEGKRLMMANDSGIHAEEIPAGHPTLASRVDQAKTLLKWIESHARVEFRPLETIDAPDSNDKDIWSTLGRDSVDAVRLADHFGIAMLADDLGLRRLLPKGSRGRSFCSVSLLPALAERAVITPDVRDAMLLQLVERGYIAIVPTRPLLLAAIREAHGALSLVTRALALLGGPVLDLSVAAGLAAEVLKASVLAPVQLIDLTQLCNLALESMSARWAPGLCAYALTKATSVEFALLPQHLKTVRKCVSTFVQSKI
jgi:hypothetical protein